MKINTQFQSHSITKVITNSCLLILIISALHIASVFSIFNSHIADTNSINKFTELQMGTLRLIYTARYHPQDMLDTLTDVEQRLSPSSQLKASRFYTASLNKKSAMLLSQWQMIKAQITAGNTQQSIAELQAFSKSVNSMIKQYQALAYKKMKLEQAVEFIEFTLIALIGIFLFYYSRKNITRPINQLVSNVNAIKAHDFTVNYPKSRNEVGLLAQGMSDMSQEIQNLIDDMQHQVNQKTLALATANKTIEFLYSISQQLSTVRLTSPILSDALNALAKQANLRKLCLELNNGTFIKSTLGCASLEENLQRIPIIVNAKPYGFLYYVANENAQDASSLIDSFTGLVARALYQEEHSLQAQKLLLMEERGIIARELHDSIAQSLSFLKIQCTILHRQVIEKKQTNATQTINNIEAAVADAYQQLRSLLSTFRLSVPGSNFKEALLSIIKTLQQQTTALITLNQFAAHLTIEASQHIHLLQIIREAIINAIKHSQCENIDISCIIATENNVWLSVSDDGLGFAGDSDKDNHYGLSIMQQRADAMGAALSFTPLTPGTEVQIIFPYTK